MMKNRKMLLLLIVAFVFIAGTAISEEEKKDLATGEGLMTREGEKVIFEPRYGYAYSTLRSANNFVFGVLLTQSFH